MRGKPEDSLVYCTKEDLGAFVYGTLPTPGKRTDLIVAVEAIRSGSSLRDLAQEDVSAVAVVKFAKGLTILRGLLQQPRSEAPFVFWLHGETGVGKTRSAFESARALARGDDDIWISSGGLRWFDGYDGQSVAIFDEFRAKHVTSFAFLLRLLDRYPMSVEFKGGFVNWVPRYILITSSKDVDTCFATRKEHVPEDIAQLARRISRVYHLEHSLDDTERAALTGEILALVRRDDGDHCEGDSIQQ